MFARLIVLCLIIIVLDIPYLAYAGPSFLQMLGTTSVRAEYALLSYLSLALGIAAQSPKDYFAAGVHGAIFGLSVYGVYNFTNLAIIPQYKLSIATRDILWGITLSAAASMINLLISKYPII